MRETKMIKNPVVRREDNGIVVEGCLKPKNRKHSTEIYEFIKERRMGRRQKVGVFVGLKDKAGYIVVGWSRANIKKDRFSKETGLKIAKGRALATVAVPFPSSLVKKGKKFCERCNRFFKVAVSEYTLTNLFRR